MAGVERSGVELYRPQFHYTPAANWINDPNGLVYYAGEYHLYYQYHPHSTLWGPMYWGHAVSPDLVNWTELSIALAPDELGMIFSGSAVIDWHNTTGFGAEAMVALFTHHIGEAPHQRQTQSQSLAYSLDRGRTWTKYADNPVLPAPDDTPDFRDPKVFWYGTQAEGYWVMCLATYNAILFYTSPNLLEWTPSGRFGDDHGCTTGVWETPDLFELPVAGEEETRWVLLVGAGEGAGAPAGGTGEQYFVGHFDGQTFTSENPKASVLWADYGADAYAGQTWSDVPDGRRIKISWMNNWVYARQLPTELWRGEMTLPRTLSLRQTSQGVRLGQQPVGELEGLRAAARTWSAQSIRADEGFIPELEPGALWEIVAEILLASLSAGTIGLRLHWDDGSRVEIGYEVAEAALYIDRTRAGLVDFHAGFAAVHDAPFQPEPGDDTLRLHLYVDRSSLELFVNHGLITMTERIFPSGDAMHVEFFAVDGSALLNRLEIYPLNGARPDRNFASSSNPLS